MTNDGARSPRAGLRELLDRGYTPAQATDALLEELPRDRDWAQWLYPFIYREAMRMESQATNRELKAQLLPGLAARPAPGSLPGAGGRTARATRNLGTLVYHPAGGGRVLWSDMTLPRLRHKIALLREYIGGVAGHVAILEAAVTVIATARGEEDTTCRIGEIEGWQEKVSALLERPAA
jgi:hypothetical protein